MCPSSGRAVFLGPPCLGQQVQLTIWQLTLMEGVIQTSRGQVDPVRPSRRAKANKRAKASTQEESENNTEELVVTRLMNDSSAAFLSSSCRKASSVTLFTLFFILKFVIGSQVTNVLVNVTEHLGANSTLEDLTWMTSCYKLPPSYIL